MVEMRKARLRALTQHLTFFVAPLIMRRNEESPIKGIDTSYHPHNTYNHYDRRNEESPIKGIDTIGIIILLQIGLPVEMRKARLRALTPVIY